MLFIVIEYAERANERELAAPRETQKAKIDGSVDSSDDKQAGAQWIYIFCQFTLDLTRYRLYYRMTPAHSTVVYGEVTNIHVLHGLHKIKRKIESTRAYEIWPQRYVVSILFKTVCTKFTEQHSCTFINYISCFPCPCICLLRIRITYSTRLEFAFVRKYSWSSILRVFFYFCFLFCHVHFLFIMV